MKDLYVCEACGWLSTLSKEYRIVGGLRFDSDCLDQYNNGIQPVAGWVAEKLVLEADGRENVRVESRAQGPYPPNAS